MILYDIIVCIHNYYGAIVIIFVYHTVLFVFLPSCKAQSGSGSGIIGEIMTLVCMSVSLKCSSNKKKACEKYLF